ncbi:MAG: XRE family transcriptional regulator [Desulfobacterales bacterium]|jgi:transcriptional regulator with XRE-family HTH domain|nr:XRE family transcriptional regulator [Desulfobacterales bacterium]
MGERKQQQERSAEYFKELTGDIAAAAPKELDEIGIRIKNIREEKGLSLDELSKLTGFDTELLANMEENKVQPQLGTVIKLSKALDSAFGRIVSGVGDKLYSVTRKNEQMKTSRATSHEGGKQVYTYMSLAPEVKGRHMEALIVRLEENPEDDMSVHDGEEFIYVLEGLVSLIIGADSFELEPGDSVYYLSTTPHLIASKKGNATILAVLYEG